MEPLSIRLVGHGLYTLAFALIFAGSAIGATLGDIAQWALVAVGVVLAGVCFTAAVLRWPPPCRTVLAVGVYAVVTGVLYITYHSPLEVFGQVGFALLFLTPVPLATIAYLREARHREKNTEARRG